METMLYTAFADKSRGLIDCAIEPLRTDHRDLRRDDINFRNAETQKPGGSSADRLVNRRVRERDVGRLQDMGRGRRPRSTPPGTSFVSEQRDFGPTAGSENRKFHSAPPRFLPPPSQEREH